MKGTSFLMSLLLLLLFGEVGHAQQLAGRLVAFRGRVEIESQGWQPAVLSQELFEGNGIRTFARSRAVILLTDETQLKVSANSELRLRTANQSSSLISRVSQAGGRTGQSILNLDRGRAYVRSKKSPARLEVETPAVTAAIRGTEFDILVRPDGETVATVLEGSIDYRNDFGAIIVNAGEQGRVRPGEAPTKTVIVNPEDAVQWTFFYTASLSPLDFPFQASSPTQAAAALQQSQPDPLQRAQLLHDAGRFDESREAISGLDSAAARELRGWLYLEQNQIAAAITELESVPRSERSRLGLALAHLRTNEFETALGYLEEGPSTPSLSVQRAAILLLLGEPETAVSLLNSIPPTSQAAAVARGLHASIHLTQNRKEEALESAREALRLAPESPSALIHLSRVHQAFFDLEAALETAERAAQLDPGFLEARVQQARLLFGFGRTREAEKIVRDLVIQAPEEASVNSLLGFLLLARGRGEEARVRLERAIRQDSTLADPHLGLGLLLMRRGRPLEAAASILSAATLEPRLSIYYSYLGKAFYEVRQFEQAFSALDTARELDPRDPTPHLYSGIFMEDLNRPGLAVEDLRKSIELNENRAVYRSRLLLDQDQASRNVNLAASFNRLGLTEWGNSSALESELFDPTNSSAHLFLGNTFLNQRGGTLAAGSELLMARLLLPVNANSFNTFNDYTTLFDRPRMYWTGTGRYGNLNSAGSRILANGGTPTFAYSAAFDYDRTDGFRSENDDRKQYNSVNFFKYALSPESDLLFSYTNQQVNQGDPGSRILVNELNDPNRRSFQRLQRVELGYHRQLRPGSDLVFLLSGRQIEQTLDDPDAFRCFGSLRCGLRRSSREPNVNLQASHLLRYEKSQFRYGFEIFEGRSRIRDLIRLPDGSTQELELTRSDLRYKTFFLRSDYRLSRNLTVTAGLNADWTNDSNRLDNRKESDWRWNPQGGLLFRSGFGATFRLAYFQHFQTHLQERFVSPHLNGFALNLNDPGETHIRAYQLGWDQRVGSRTFVRSVAFWRDREIPTLAQQGAAHLDGHLYGSRVTLNQLLTERLTLAPRYSVSRSLDQFSLRHDHEVDLALHYVHPSGLFLTLSENFLRQTGEIGRRATSVKAYTTDFSAAYEMPRKLGLFTFTVTNLFDRRYQFLADPLAVNPRIPAREIEAGLSFYF